MTSQPDLFPDTLATQQIIHDDCLNAMKQMDDNSIDFITTDPPYGLNFMSKKWDSETPKIEIWKECLRICKPGAMIAVFGGSRTHHRLMCSIEDAGFEIRDVIMWLTGQGFPKSMDISKAIDKESGCERKIVGRKSDPRYDYDYTKSRGFNYNDPTSTLGRGDPGIITEANCSLAKIFSGYGTSLKPNYEPIILAMKPCDGTFANNAKKWGVAGINIDECRIETREDAKSMERCNTPGSGSFHKGRWPANLILDEEAAEMLDQSTPFTVSKSNERHNKRLPSNSWSDRYKPNIGYGHDDSGGASRFFYCAKASPSDRNKGLEDFKNTHPTVKPISLMKYILKLLAPPGNPICLDPFMGSGTTGIACKELNINFIGIEKELEYFEIAKKRIENGSV